MLNYRLKGMFSWAIIDQNNQVVDSEPTRNNLILTQGINAVAVRTFVENMLYCAIGTSTAAPLLSDVALGGEVQRTGDVDTNVQTACITSLSGNTYSLTKTFKFPVNASPLTVGEIGWSWSASAGNNLFSKALIIKNGVPEPVTLDVGQYLRVRYTLEITMSPSTATIGSANITGWSANGQSSVQLIGLRNISNDGSIGFYDASNGCNEPAISAGAFLGTSSLALAAFGSSADRSGGTNFTSNTSNTYLGNGRLVKLASFAKNLTNSSLRSVGVGSNTNPQTNSGFVFVFDSNQVKASDYLIPIQFIYTWSS